jgi:hypothetical protein
MATITDFCPLRLFIVLFVFITSHNYMNGQITTTKLNVFTYVEYQCHSNQSILDQTAVRSSVQCAGRCIQNPKCATATFDQTSLVCSLFTETTNVGQLIQHSERVTFEREGEFLSRVFSQFNSVVIKRSRVRDLVSMQSCM